jgi:WD40 repeat protein/tRNA A-37 threonylcarbamoyl transferase component Bud32
MPEVAGYEVLCELGRGAKGVVYKARHFKLNRMVALKMVLAGEHAASVDLVRFLAEAEAAAQLQHPHIVQVHEIGKHARLPFLSLEYVDGGTLAQKLKGTPLQPRQAAAWTQILARAVQFAHQHGIVHRDLKPGNILLTSDGSPKITDFGLAKRIEMGAGMTQTGIILGTPSYMAPEQAEGKKDVGPAADTYALGAILYEMLTGRPPFQAPTPLDTVLQVIGEEPVPPRRLQSTVPRDLETVCLKCLQKDPRKRYPGAEALADDLARFLDGRPIQARPVGRPERAWRWCRRNPWVAGMTAAVMLLLVVLAVGASVAALWLGAAKTETEANLIRAKAAEQDGLRKRARELLEGARARRFSRQPGQRFESLKALAKCAEIVRGLEPLDEDMLQQVRDEVIASLALVDLREDREWKGHPADARVIVFDDALERYARRDVTGAISVRRVKDDEQIRMLPGSGGWRGLSVMRFSPDGRYLAATMHTMHAGPELKVWDLDRPDPIFEGVDGVFTADFTPDSKRVVFPHPNDTLHVVELGDGNERVLPAIEATIRWITVHPDGHRVALSVGDPGGHRVQVWSLDTGELLANFPHPEMVGTVAWHPNGIWLAAPCDDRGIYLWDVQAKKQTAVLEGYKNGGIVVAFSPVGDLLASMAWESSLRLWDPKTGKELLHAPTGMADLHFTRDGRRLAGAIRGTSLVTYEVADGREYRTLVSDPAQGKGLYNDVSVSPDGRLLAVGMGDGARVWDLADGRELAFVPTGGRTPGVLFHTSGDLLTGSLNRAGLQRWPIRLDPEAPGQSTIGPRRPLFSGNIERIAQSLNGRAVAFNSASQGAMVFNPEALTRLPPLLEHEGAVHVAVSPDGRFVATGTHGGAGIKVFRAGDGQLERSFATDAGAAPAFSPKNRWLAICTDTECRLWRVGTWEEGPRVPTSIFHVVAFSPDGLLAVAETPSTIALVDPETGRTLARLKDPNQDRSIGIGFSPDGAQLIITTDDSQAVRVWDLRRIREHLNTMDLDWKPAYKPAPPPAGPVRLKVIPADQPPPSIVLLPPKPGGRAATPEQIAGWIKQLGEDNVKASAAAAAALEETGPPALTALTEAANNPDAALKRKIKTVMDRIEVAAAVAPVRIYLKLDDALIADAVATLSQKAGVGLIYEPQNRPNGKPPPTITLDLDGVPFWDALDKLCRAAGLVCPLEGAEPWRLTEGTLPPAGLVTSAGPLRLQATGLNYNRNLFLQGPMANPTENLALNLTIQGVSGTQIMAIGSPRVLEAKDDTGASLVPEPRPEGPYSSIAPPQSLSRFVTLKPHDRSSKAVKRLAGVLPVEVMVRRRDVLTVADPAKSGGKTLQGEDGLRLRVDSVSDLEKDRIIFRIRLSVPARQRFDPNLVEADLSDSKAGRRRSTSSSLRMLAETFRELEPNDLIWLSGSPQGGFPALLPWDQLAADRPPLQRRHWQGTIEFYAPDKLYQPDKLLLYRFERFRTELPFEFHDLPLP